MLTMPMMHDDGDNAEIKTTIVMTVAKYVTLFESRM